MPEQEPNHLEIIPVGCDRDWPAMASVLDARERRISREGIDRELAVASQQRHDDSVLRAMRDERVGYGVRCLGRWPHASARHERVMDRAVSVAHHRVHGSARVEQRAHHREVTVVGSGVQRRQADVIAASRQRWIATELPLDSREISLLCRLENRR